MTMSNRNIPRLPTNVVTDATSDVENNYMTRFEKCRPSTNSFDCFNRGNSRDAPNEYQKDINISSLQGRKRQLYDSGLGDSLLNSVRNCQQDFAVEGSETASIVDEHRQRLSDVSYGLSCLSLSNRNYGSIGKDEGYESVVSSASSISHGSGEKSCQLLERRNNDGDTTLHLMIIYMLLAEISFLVDLATNPAQLNMVNYMQQSPLILAALTKQPQVVRKLLTAGADLLLPDRHGNTALHVATGNGDLETVKALTTPLTASEASSFKHPVPTQRIPQDLNLKNYEGYAPVHMAAAEGHSDVFEYLSELGADVDEMEAKSGLRPLHIAIEHSDRELIRVIAEDCASDIDATTFYGLSPVKLAAERGLLDVVVYLVNLGADRTDIDVPEISDMEDGVEDMDVGTSKH